MSKISLTPNDSGTGTFTIQSPDSDTNRTFTLPDADGEVLTDGSSLDASNLTGTLPALDGSSLTGVSPTTFAAVGTYSWVIDYGVGQDLGDTIAGSTIRPARIDRSANVETGTGTSLALGSAEAVLSGTWRIMSGKNDGNDSTRSYFFLALRIS